MTRLQSIENALSSINETVFQELCDSFLILRNPNYSVFSRTGSQLGKKKTIKAKGTIFITVALTCHCPANLGERILNT